jgi:1,2-phenylacetyl-CoA epoxidase PaaB subunit
MSMYRVKFAPRRFVHIDVDAPNAAAAIATARDIWNRNALNSEFVVTEPAHDAAFGEAHAVPLQKRFEVRICEARAATGWVDADSEDDAIATAEALYDREPERFDVIEQEVTEIAILDSKEAP